jgi:hypothetical protein
VVVNNTPNLVMTHDNDERGANKNMIIKKENAPMAHEVEK